MDLIEYEKLIQSEEAARSYLLGFCWKEGRRFCPRCGQHPVYVLSDRRLRCGGCRYTFHDFTARWLNLGGLSCRDWLRLVKLFELELTALKMCGQLRLAYNTIYKAVTAVRFALLAQAIDAPQLLSGPYGERLGFAKGRLRMERASGEQEVIPVFGLMDKGGWIFADFLPHIEAADVIHFHRNFQLPLERMGQLVYTDRYQRYDALIFCGDAHLPYGLIQKSSRKPYVDSLKGGFWNFARPRLKRFNGVTSRRFPLYLKELEFRYNHKSEDIFPILVRHLCSLVPKSE
jgi:transposase